MRPVATGHWLRSSLQAVASVSLMAGGLHLNANGYISAGLVVLGGAGLAAAGAVRSWREASAARDVHAAPDGLEDFHRAQAMLDLVAASLLTLHPDGRVAPENRVARRLIGEGAASLARIPEVGPEAAARIEALPSGGRDIVRLANGAFVLVRTTRFKAAASGAVRLLALQRLDDDLQAVEVKAWRDLAAVLAHEIMNSLTPISSMSERLRTLLERGDLGAENVVEIRRIADIIARRSTGLTSFVGAYRRITEVPEPQLERLKIHALIEHVTALATSAGASLTIAHDAPESLEAVGDRALLEQALLNLLRNAVDAVAQHQAPQIRITARAQGEDLILAVSDNGPGVTHDDQDSLFVPFFTTKPQGTGLGLAVVRQVALAHGGRVQSGPGLDGHGLTVRMILPRRQSAEASNLGGRTDSDQRPREYARDEMRRAASGSPSRSAMSAISLSNADVEPAPTRAARRSSSSSR